MNCLLKKGFKKGEVSIKPINIEILSPFDNIREKCAFLNVGNHQKVLCPSRRESEEGGKTRL